MKYTECKNFRGDKPCRYSEGKLCKALRNEPCANFSPIGKMILIIKLGALGDVLRTTTLLPAIQKTATESSIVWITQPGALPLLEGASLYKSIPWGLDSVLWAESINWHTVISLDKEEGPTTLASKVKASYKYGFGRNQLGILVPLSPATDYLYRLGIDDHEKFVVNKKTYPELIADACNLPWEPNKYVLNLSDSERKWADNVLPECGTHRYIGLNVGSGEAFAGKKWPLENFITLSNMLKDAGYIPVFLGGSREKDLYQSLKTSGKAAGLFPGCEFSLREFMGIVSKLRVMVAGDTLAMHIGIALGVWQVTFFGSTTEREIEFYGKGEALVKKLPCAPCYKRVCPTKEECMSSISVNEVFHAIQRGC
ncbi:MAG: glycosyltransferase family 9 protein [Candidatus Riflebacteria bacterium]|nr:glycosyltransferase family 9 protein [Candidatus Riflebacteria bacterium]